MAQAHSSSSSSSLPPFPLLSSSAPPRRPSSAATLLRGSGNRSFPRQAAAAATVEREWIRRTSAYRSNARVVCLGAGGSDEAREAARKALESALGGKKDAFNKWDEEIKKRESGGGFGGSGGRGGQGGDQQDGDSWEETKQVIFAVTGLVAVYLLITQGKSILAFTVNGILFVLRGFKEAPDSPESSSVSSVPRGVTEAAEAHVMSKWGRD